ncbi:hypothetical protein [Streptomyces sp. NPDC051364]|uniref:hypothetical protein n=1 Tax=Streptomyces sp. NPDC051364 TaxID=3155799 RepID=UPI00341DA265
MAVVNKAESVKKRRRIRDRHQDRILDGLPHSGPRPFGREEDRKTLRPDEAMFLTWSIDERIKGEAMLLAKLAEEKPTAEAGRQSWPSWKSSGTRTRSVANWSTGRLRRQRRT